MLTIPRDVVVVCVEQAIARTAGLTTDDIANLREAARTATVLGINFSPGEDHPGCIATAAGVYRPDADNRLDVAVFATKYDDALRAAGYQPWRYRPSYTVEDAGK